MKDLIAIQVSIPSGELREDQHSQEQVPNDEKGQRPDAPIPRFLIRSGACQAKPSEKVASRISP